MNELPLQALIELVRAAGQAILPYWRQPLEVSEKSDSSPVTAADLAAHACLRDGLQALGLGIPLLSEEDAEIPLAERLGWSRWWLVDPLDGTKEFIGRNGEFTVNIALVEDGEPVLGTVFAPAIERLFLGATGVGAFVEEDGHRRPIRCRAVAPAGLTVVASRSHGDAAALDAFLGGRRVAALTNAGSSLKLCLVAAGEADLYPRLGRTMEWDIAAGHAVLAAAGGRVLTLAGEPLRYGKPGLDNPHFVASGLD